MTPPSISVLVAARKNSKYLAKFLFGFFSRTANPNNTEVLVISPADDTWNEELRWHFESQVHFYTEDKGLGRAGLHEYLNELVQHAQGDWIIYFCEDHFIKEPDWDQIVRFAITERNLHPREPWCIIPKFDNCGAMNQIVSRGWVEALGGVLGRHGWIDSYINDVNEAAFGSMSKRVIRLDEELFHDFTHDKPSPMSDAHLQSVVTPAARKLPAYDSNMVRELIKIDGYKLIDAARRFDK